MSQQPDFDRFFVPVKMSIVTIIPTNCESYQNRIICHNYRNMIYFFFYISGGPSLQCTDLTEQCILLW